MQEYDKRVRVTILFFTTAPARREFQAIFGTTSQTSYLLLFFFLSARMETWLCKSKHRVRLLPQIEAGGHVKPKSLECSERSEKSKWLWSLWSGYVTGQATSKHLLLSFIPSVFFSFIRNALDLACFSPHLRLCTCTAEGRDWRRGSCGESWGIGLWRR